MLKTINHGLIRELQLNRPPVNALSPELVTALRQAIEAAPRDGARAIVLSGIENRFSGGLDVPLLMELDRQAVGNLWREFYALMATLARSPIPIAAAITGHAPAGGTVLPMFCDWRVMAKGSFKLGLSEVQVGIPLPPVILAGLRRLVGPRQAERLAVGALLISPEEAAYIGLVDELTDPDQVVSRAIARCQGLLTLPSEAMSITRQQARADLVALFSDKHLDRELDEVIAGWFSPSTQETLQALVQKLGRKTAV
jgi:enoyl-CoA hydratase/carnithine racemase